MESSLKTLYLFFSFFFALLSSSHAYTFNVGGREGWTLHPSENYNQWSGRLRFLINDALHFKYKASDSVLEVNKGDYDNCNTTNPITKLSGGDSYFTLNRSGPFYFISGNKSNCDQGQKLTVVVISPKSKSKASPPGSSSHSPSGSPISSPPQPGTTIPSSPASSPSGSSSPASSPSDSSSSAGTPAYSPGGSESSSPAGTPAYSPAYSPGGSDISSPAGSPANSPPGSASSSPTGNPADANAPPPAGSSSEKLAVSAIFTFPVAIFIFGFGFLH